MATDNFDTEIDDIGVNSLEGVLDDSGVFRLRTPNISSYNFDGAIGSQRLNIAASAVQPGMQISLTGSADVQTYYTVLFINNDDEELSASPSKLVTIQYLDEDAFPQILSIGASVTLFAQIEDWDNKYIGENGWYIGTSGNAIFSNVAIRGEIEATTMDIGGAEGIIYDGNTVTIGASVIINAALTVGASGNFIVSGSAAQDIISNNTTITGGNIATGKIKSTGYSGPGTASAFSTSGMLINLDDGSISSNNFRIDDLGNAFFQGSINATSGSFSGWVKSASITGGIITSGSFVGGVVQSSGYSGVFDGSGFSTTGTHINLNTGAITGKQFRIDSSGNAVFAGSLSAATGTFSGNLSAAGGTFAGTLSANSITSGTLDASIISVTNLNASNITTGTLSGRLLQTSGYSGVTNGSAFSSLGTMAINLSNGTITAPGFRINASGAAFFQGDITGSNGTFSGTVSANNVTAGTLTGSTFRSSAGITATSGNGVYLDASGNLRVAQSTSALTFNGSTGALSVAGGTITGGQINGSFLDVISGYIGRFLISDGSLTTGIGANANIVGLTNSTTNPAIFAGATLINGSDAKFKVSAGGQLTATGANITGVINATSGKIGSTAGGWNIGNGYLYGNGISLATGLDVGSGGIYFTNSGPDSLAGGMFFDSANSAIAMQGSFSSAASKNIRIYAGTGGGGLGTIYFNASTITANGTFAGTNNLVITGGTYSNPTWLTSLDAAKITTGTLPGARLTGVSPNFGGVDSTGVYKVNGTTFMSTARALTVDGITNQTLGITNNGGQITSLPTWQNSTTGIETIGITTAGVFRRISSTQNIKYDMYTFTEPLSISVNLNKITGTPTVNLYDVLNLSVTEFSLIDNGIYTGQRKLGFIAEDVYDKMPIAAALDNNGNPSGVLDTPILASLLAIVRDQQKIIENLQNRVLQLESQLGG